MLSGSILVTSARSSILVVILVFGLLFALIGFSSLSRQNIATGTGIINGTVMRSPTQPVCHTDQPCSAPATGVNVTVAPSSGGGPHVAVTNSNGVYSIQVPAGSYLVSVQGLGIPPVRNYTHQVSVEVGQNATANFEIDTGIR